MRKSVFALLVGLLANFTFAQNIQLHYDLGEDRKHLTSTVEYFKPDKWGSTFFFIDFNYNGDKGGVDLSYMEVARNIKISKKIPIQAHIEYNGGHFGTNGFGVSFNNAFIVGGYYDLKITDGFTLGTMLGYKYIENSRNKADFQTTLVWYKPLGKKFLFTGFLDLWSQDKLVDGKQLVFLTEPQIWYSLNKHFRVGGEIEVSKNFVSEDFQVNPTLGIRWDL